MNTLIVSKLQSFAKTSIDNCNHCEIFQESKVYSFTNILGNIRLTQFFWLNCFLINSRRDFLVRVSWDEGKSNYSLIEKLHLKDKMSLETFEEFVQEQTKRYQVVGE